MQGKGYYGNTVCYYKLSVSYRYCGYCRQKTIKSIFSKRLNRINEEFEEIEQIENSEIPQFKDFEPETEAVQLSDDVKKAELEVQAKIKRIESFAERE